MNWQKDQKEVLTRIAMVLHECRDSKRFESEELMFLMSIFNDEFPGLGSEIVRTFERTKRVPRKSNLVMFPRKVVHGNSTR